MWQSGEWRAAWSAAENNSQRPRGVRRRGGEYVCNVDNVGNIHKASEEMEKALQATANNVTYAARG